MCLFCEIIRGEKPCYNVYENEHVLAFLDIYPTVPGHVLVLPKKHVERLDQLEDPCVSAGLMQGLVDVSRMLVEAGLCTDFTIFSDNGEQAEQDIPHLHFHVIPREENEDFHIISPVHSKSSTQEALTAVWKRFQ